jgi:hypothetical protein
VEANILPVAQVDLLLLAIDRACKPQTSLRTVEEGSDVCYRHWVRFNGLSTLKRDRLLRKDALHLTLTEKEISVNAVARPTRRCRW